MTWAKAEFQSLFAEPSRNGVYKAKEHHGSGARIINMGELFAHDRIGRQEMARLQMTEQELEKAAVANGDLLFGRRSLVEEGAGRCALVQGIEEPTTFESSIIRVRLKREVADPSFYFYYFRSPIGRSLIRSIVSGATVKGIRGSDLQRIGVDHPPLAVQERIATRISYFDDLIETNRRRIVLLEESARLLYREWFVDLRFPGHESAKFKDGLPEGWRQTSVGRMASFVNRGIAPRYDDAATGLVVNQKCIRNGQLSLAAARRNSKEVKAERLLQVGDVLINSTGAGTLGRVALVRSPISNCTTDTHVTIVRPMDVECSAFLGVSLLELEPVLSTMGVGSTNQLELGRADISSLPLIEPTGQVQNDFHNLVWPMLMQSETLAKTNAQLIRARDDLLPKLMSGEIQV